MDAFMEQVEHILVEDGVARTKNRRVKVKMIASKYVDGDLTPQEIADQYGITLADVYAALTYYYDYKEVFDAAEKSLQPLIEQAKEESAARLAKMRARMKAIKDDQES